MGILLASLLVKVCPPHILNFLKAMTEIWPPPLLEYRKHYLTHLFGSPYYGCYFLAVIIFSLGILRDHLYNEALNEQPFFEPLHQPLLACGLLAVGNVLVLSSMWALGLTGTYLGDYFGILMDAPVAGFPFNVSSAPMYWGSTMSFLGVALYKGSVAGLLLTAEVFVLYWFALRWEEYVDLCYLALLSLGLYCVFYTTAGMAMMDHFFRLPLRVREHYLLPEQLTSKTIIAHRFLIFM